MQEIFEKIIEKFTNIRRVVKNDEDLEWNRAEYKCKQIVEQAIAEYNNGWIPCEEEMPKEHDSIFAKLKGTDKWNDEMFEKISDTVNVTVVDEYGNRITTHAHTVDGKWSCDLLKLNKTYKITAWQSLPEPYHPKGE